MAGEVDRIRMATQTGRPVGDDIFIAKVENMTGRDLSKGALGRRRFTGACPFPCYALQRLLLSSYITIA